MTKCDHGRETVRAELPNTETHERFVDIVPGFFCPVSGGNGHGNSGGRLTFYTREKATEKVGYFQLFTDWNLKETYERWERQGIRPEMSRAVADAGVHSPTPMYDGQSEMECSLMPAGKCYPDGSALYGETLYWIFAENGISKMYQELEEWMGP